MQDAKIQQVAALLNQAQHIAVLTGAGISKESGIPTFRDALMGYWANYDPTQLATPEGFRSDPTLVWRWYADRRALLETAQPNPGHYALAELAQRKWVTIITQNIDGLHQAAGSAGVLEVHGTLRGYKCIDCESPYEMAEIPAADSTPPLCDCGGLIRPAVIWFNELLPEAVMAQAIRACETCDVMLSIGTSGLVWPAAGLPLTAKEHGATLIEINPETTMLTSEVDIYLQGRSGELLPRVVATMGTGE